MTATVTVFVPIRYHGTTFEEVAVINGNRVPSKYQTRDHNGHVVVDFPFSLFQRMLAGDQGLLWADANPEAIQWLGEADRRTMTCSAFPGIHRPGPARVPIRRPAEPVMVRMRAPDGCSGISVEGEALVIGEDRTVTVTDAVAEILRGHGFTSV